jgi:hypothetical protein
MSTRLENYIIYGIKLGEEFTEEYWEKDFYPEMEYDKSKEFKPLFLTDGMNGNYTYFGFIKDLNEDNETVLETIKLNPFEIQNKFNELYPEMTMPEIKLYHVPHWV